jgi:UPF0716 family protein affecting phage T7 exclusion
MKLEKNMNSTDRLIRAIIAVVAAVLYFTGTVTGALGLVLLIVAVIFMLTSIFAVCPLYLLFKVSTVKK